MYYLFRTNGSLRLLDGKLVNGMICKKGGSFFNRTWIPMLAEPVLRELGLLDNAIALANSGDAFSLLTDPLMATGVYRPGTNVEGEVIGDDELPQIFGIWLRESGMGVEVERNLPHVLPNARARAPLLVQKRCQ